MLAGDDGLKALPGMNVPRPDATGDWLWLILSIFAIRTRINEQIVPRMAQSLYLLHDQIPTKQVLTIAHPGR